MGHRWWKTLILNYLNLKNNFVHTFCTKYVSINRISVSMNLTEMSLFINILQYSLFSTVKFLMWTQRHSVMSHDRHFSLSGVAHCSPPPPGTASQCLSDDSHFMAERQPFCVPQGGTTPPWFCSSSLVRYYLASARSTGGAVSCSLTEFHGVDLHGI